MDSEMIFPVLIGSVVGLFLLYLIIVTAVKAATKEQTIYLKLLYRSRIKQMVKEGFISEEIVKMENDSDSDFWLSAGIQN
jgi:hypothetical protein